MQGQPVPFGNGMMQPGNIMGQMGSQPNHMGEYFSKIFCILDFKLWFYIFLKRSSRAFQSVHSKKDTL